MSSRSLEPVKESETAPVPAVGSLSKLSGCHIFAECLGQSHTGSLVVGSASVSPL